MSYTMPVNFGENDLLGSMDEDAHVVHDEVTSIFLSYTTDRQQLEQYLPQGFEVTEPLVQIFAAKNNGCRWLAGRSYNVIGVTVPVIFRGKIDEVKGSYVLVLWEDVCEAIMGGREQTGIPKVYADIEEVRLHKKKWHSSASCYGNKFIEITLNDSEEVIGPERRNLRKNKDINNMMAWRYIPNIGRPGAALSHATLYPQEIGPITKTWIGEPRAQWRNLTWDQSPTQYKISSALKRLPILEYRHGLAVNASAKLLIGLARELR